VLDISLGDERAAAIASACEALRDVAFERLLAEGRAMSLDEAIASALGTTTSCMMISDAYDTEPR
jgi:hypothetical protein